MNLFSRLIEKIKISLLDDSKRLKLQFIWVFCVLIGVTGFMSVVNFLTEKYLLMTATLSFGVLCAINVFLAKHNEKTLYISGWIFSVEMIALLTFFVVSGTPEGFSAIWACLLPASGLLLFKRKRGTLFCAVMFVILVFFLDTPLGNSFLQYPYTTSFKLRFPMLYLAFFIISLLLETIRSLTFDAMEKARERSEYLYRHDALTEVYNRYGFNELMDELLNGACQNPVALMILDLDYFKRINDKYGHVFGDVVLKRTAALIEQVVGERGSVCRWGGEEFAILISNEQDPVTFAEEILKAIRSAQIDMENGQFHITASIGVAMASSCANVEPASLVRAADVCLYAAKDAGRDTVIGKQIVSH